MKIFFKNFIIAIAIGLLFLPLLQVQAGTPNLSVNLEGSNSVRLTINGADPYASVVLYQRQGTELWTVITNFGTTDQNGYFSGTYGLTSSQGNQTAEFYVRINGMQSAVTRVNPSSDYYCGTYCPGNYYGNTSTITFSQNNVTLSPNQSQAVTIYGGSNGNYYFSSTPDPSVLTASVSGNTVYLSARVPGYTQTTICSGGVYQCGTLYVTVTSPGQYYGNISFSESNPSLTVGQSRAITISSSNSYANQNYYINNNTNSSVVQASINSNILNLYGIRAGSSTVTVCQTNNSCNSLYIIVRDQYQAPYPTTPIYPPYPPYAPPYQLTSGTVYGTSTFKNGTLVNDSGAVYIVYKNTKSFFKSKQALEGLGFKWNSIENASTYGLVDSGHIISTSNRRHPWGTWIKTGNTVYFVHEQGLIPVSDYNTFLNNGGQDKFVAPANLHDFDTPILSNMTINDSRLR